MGHDHIHATATAARRRADPTLDVAAPAAPVPLPARPAPVIRRAFAPADVQPMVSERSLAPIDLPQGKLGHLRRVGDEWQWSRDQGGTWTTLTAPQLAQLAGMGTWSGKIVVMGRDGDLKHDVVDMAPAAADGKLAASPSEDGFTVSEIPRDVGGTAAALEGAGGYVDPALGSRARAKPAKGKAPTAPGDRHSVVHHTANTDGTGAHLTVENAHLELMLALKESGTTSAMDKHVEQKPGINELLTTRGANEIDNLNFFPAEPAKGGAKAKPKAEEAAVSLQDYLALITKALGTLTDVPPVYAAKIMQAATRLAALTKLDMGQLFLRQGNGDERHLIRALMVMKQNKLADLALPQPVVDLFARYATSKPDLPLSDPVTPATEWVVKGAQAKDGKTTWTDLESKYVKQYFPEFAKAVKAYAAPG